MLPTFRTPRLEIHPFGQGEADQFLAIWGDPEVIWWGALKPDDAEKAYGAMLRRIDGMPEGMGWAWLIERSTGSLVGDTSLQPAPAEFGGYEVGWHLVRSHWGKGFATEGTAPLLKHAWALGLDEVIATIVPMNLRSVRVAERLGMERRGDTIQRSNLAHGVWVAKRPR
jgi:RimJ/RimL family protein N-acetyltransferase